MEPKGMSDQKPDEKIVGLGLEKVPNNKNELPSDKSKLSDKQEMIYGKQKNVEHATDKTIQKDSNSIQGFNIIKRIRNKNGTSDIDIVLHEFSNKIFVIVTEFQKICNVFTIRNDELINPLSSQRLTNSRQLFGLATDETDAAIHYLSKNLCEFFPNKEIIMSLALKTVNSTKLKLIENSLTSLLTKPMEVKIQ